MKSVLASEIVITDNRQRREFNPADIAELSRSIQNLGLMHPIVCREDFSNGTFVLVAGERRLRAMEMLIELEVPIKCDGAVYFSGTVPISLMSELTAEQAYEAELEENIIRVDLTWQERANATAAIHALRSAQALERGDKQTLTQTALEISGNEATSNDTLNLRHDLIIAENLADPEVAKASSKKEALKIIEKKAVVAHRAELAKTFDLTKTKHTLHKGDSFKILPTIPDQSVDCILTDPPYGVDASAFGSNFATQHEYQDDWNYFVDLSFMLSREAYRVLKNNTHAYVFCSFEGFSTLARDFESIGFKVWQQPLIWSKGNGNAPWVNKGHKRTYECILYAMKGSRDVTTVKSDVLTYSPVSDRDHGAEKPVPLLVDLLQRSTNPGDCVLDPFAGSGSIFPAADVVKCKAVGIERGDDSFNLALSKLESVPQTLSLTDDLLDI